MEGRTYGWKKLFDPRLQNLRAFVHSLCSVKQIPLLIPKHVGCICTFHADYNAVRDLRTDIKVQQAHGAQTGIMIASSAAQQLTFHFICELH